MTISKKDIQKVSELARLDLNDKELNKYTTELGKILDYVQRLEKVDTKEIDPLIYNICNSTLEREDVVLESSELNQFRDLFLKLAPKTEGRFFKVPKMGK